jgi:hypothetical protein
MFGPYSDYLVPLLKILDDLPKRMGRGENILALFETYYQKDIPIHAHRLESKSGKKFWVRCVYNVQGKARELGLVDNPSRGVWRLTDKGHEWLMEYPNATHYTFDKSGSKRATTPTRSKFGTQIIKGQLTPDNFFDTLQTELAASLRPVLGSGGFSFYSYHHYLKVSLEAYRGSHYEVIKQRDKHVIALHFEGKAENNQERVQVFIPYLEQITQDMGIQVEAGNYQNRGWTHVWIDLPLKPFSLQLAKEYAEITAKFIRATYPILDQAYLGSKRRRSSKYQPDNKRSGSVYSILDREIDLIKAYLQGLNSFQPSNEKLCDWVNFCYSFELYREGRDLFTMISPEQVNPWYYDRTKKLARLCMMKATG